MLEHYPSDDSTLASAYRIRDIVELTGASKESIHFYINAGLLPRPRKSARNMAWYSDEHVRQIRLIRELQDQQFLPLKAIRALLHGTDDYTFTPQQLQSFSTMRARIHRDEPPEAISARSVESVLADHRISEQEFDELKDAGLLTVVAGIEGATLDESGRRILEIWSGIRDAGLTQERGFSPRDIQMLQSVIELLFEQEVLLFMQRFKSLTDAESVSIIERVVPLINDALGVLHQRRIGKFLEGVGQGVAAEAKPEPSHR